MFHAPVDLHGATLTSGQVKYDKGLDGRIGITLDGGAPNCPCIYIKFIAANSPVDLDGILEVGDELLSVNGISIKGIHTEQAADVIRRCGPTVALNYNKLHLPVNNHTDGCSTAGGPKSFDIIMKKIKHRLTEKLSPTAANAFGISRAVLCNDSLVQKLNTLEQTETVYSELKQSVRNTLRAFRDLNKIYKAFGDCFTEIGCCEKQPDAGEAFRQFGEVHRQFERQASSAVMSVARTIADNLETYLSKAIPDTRLTIDKYQDAKFEYLSYCLKIKEMEDEQKDCASMNEYLTRVESGNYEYRLNLKRRLIARQRFCGLRADVLAKIELLDQKHVSHLSSQLQLLMTSFEQYNEKCYQLLDTKDKFPLELDLSKCFGFDYEESNNQTNQTNNLEDEDGDEDEESQERQKSDQEEDELELIILETTH